MKKYILIALTLLATMPLSFAAYAAGEAPTPPKEDWSFNGPFGTYDRAAMQRGLKVYRNVCASCHSLKHIAFRNLSDIGYTEGQIKTIAAEYTIEDGPNDEGDMFERPGRPSDHFPNPYANDKQAAATNNGALPPDLSLITKARKYGADYVHGLLTGYTDVPANSKITILEGQHYNKYMPGHVIAMAAPLTEGVVAYDDGSPETVEQYSRDVTHFLTWAGEPSMENRKRMGIKVVLFLLVFSGLMYAYKKKIWSDLH